MRKTKNSIPRIKYVDLQMHMYYTWWHIIASIVILLETGITRGLGWQAIDIAFIQPREKKAMRAWCELRVTHQILS